MIADLEYGLNSVGLYTLTCTTSGTPPTSVTWTRNGVIISDDDSMYKSTQVLVDRNNTEYENRLTVTGSFEDAVGDYSCTAENSIGTSDTVNRTIKGKHALTLNGQVTSIGHHKFLSSIYIVCIPKIL